MLFNKSSRINWEDSRFVHQGMTSSDVLDTTLSIQLKKSNQILLRGIDELLLALKNRALEHKETLTIGRSHGIHAEPMTFGLKLASFTLNLKETKSV